MNSELEENRELAENRLIELQKLEQDLQNVQQENSGMKVFALNAAFFWTLILATRDSQVLLRSTFLKLLEANEWSPVGVTERSGGKDYPSVGSLFTPKSP